VADSSLKSEGESPVEAGVVDIDSPLSDSKLRYDDDDDDGAYVLPVFLFVFFALFFSAGTGHVFSRNPPP
jgi:hypothetical protein